MRAVYAFIEAAVIAPGWPGVSVRADPTARAEVILLVVVHHEHEAVLMQPVAAAGWPVDDLANLQGLEAYRASFHLWGT